MRILHLCQRDHPDTGGSLRVAEALAHEQRALGHEPWLLFLYGPPAEIAKATEPFSMCLGIGSSRQMFKGLVTLSKALGCIKPDIIHLHDGITWPRLALLHCSCPVVMHAHLPVHSSMHFVSWLLIRKTTDHLIGISEHTINSWVDAGFPLEKITYIPNGVDFGRFGVADRNSKENARRQLNLPQDVRILLWVGRLHRKMKGVDRLERIAGIMPEGTMLVVVGNGPEYKGMQQDFAEYIDQGKLKMVGSVSAPEHYYKAADTFLFSSHFEPFGLVILEAVASGLPIVSFPVDQGGGAVELLEEFSDCKVDDKMSDSAIGKAIDHTFTSSDLRLDSSELVKSKYSWSSIVRHVMELYGSQLGLDMNASLEKPKVLVCQHGSRHRYAIPRMLEKEGLLCAFYTDSSSVSLLGRVAAFLEKVIPKWGGRYTGRKIRGIPKEKIYSSDRSFFYELYQSLFFSRKIGIYLFSQRHRVLSTKMIQWGLQHADIIYSMYHENLDFIRWAKEQGAKSAVDVFISPITEKIMEEELAHFPDWKSDNDPDSLLLEQKLWKETVAVADLLICPSDWVAEGVREISPEAADKTIVVPYGCSIDYQGRTNKPVKGRVLFAGRDPLRKGLHYLAQATSKLTSICPDLDVRIAGNLSKDVVAHPLCKDLNFIGQLTGEQMKDEYLSADMLVLPALSEGFAGVVAEAIGAGCPVIVTKEAGSPVIHEREGLVVPSRNSDALAEGIQRMIDNRELRDRCSAECLNQVPFYSEDMWQKRLSEALYKFSGQ